LTLTDIEVRNPSERGSALWGTGGRNGDSRKRGWLKVVPIAVLAALLVAPTALAGKPVKSDTQKPATPVKSDTRKPAERDTQPPETTLTAGPSAGATVSGSVTFSFSANEPATFECALDNSSFRECSSSTSHTVRHLKPGEHTFKVRATDASGLRDTTPAEVTFTYVPYLSTKEYPAGTFLWRAKRNPLKQFKVIVQTDSRFVLGALSAYARDEGKLKRTFTSVDGVAANLPGYAILFLTENEWLAGKVEITEDAPVRLLGETPPELWQEIVKLNNVDTTIAARGAKAPAIAIVDSGVDTSKVEEFGARVIKSVSMVADDPENVDDDHGHGTFVAAIAAGANGAAPTADIVSVRVMDESGGIRTSDVIAAADWILANKDTYGIRVANFSLHSANQSSFKFDPLDAAVERLWFNGVVVVAAAGNFGDGTAKHMVYAPGNDPFVITVGASDPMDTLHPEDDTVPSWSAFGYTADGFSKPELVAPGRYMIGPVPADGLLAAERPSNVIEPGLMRLSGTSFAAPVVAGAAAQLLAVNPAWGPDQVKGALMATAHPLPAVENGQADGIGLINVALASKIINPPNPNAALNQFVVNGEFDAAAWTAAADGDVAWADVAWSDVAWSDVAWGDVAWSDVAWGDVAWSDVAWSDVAWSDVAWSDVAWSDVAWADVAWADVAWADAAFASVAWADVAWADRAFEDVAWADVAWADVAWAD
jgi:serine protease AprX